MEPGSAASAAWRMPVSSGWEGHAVFSILPASSRTRSRPSAPKWNFPPARMTGNAVLRSWSPPSASSSSEKRRYPDSGATSTKTSTASVSKPAVSAQSSLKARQSSQSGVPNSTIQPGAAADSADTHSSVSSSPNRRSLLVIVGVISCR